MIARTAEQQAEWDARPEWGSPAWHAWHRSVARLGFVRGHMGPAGVDDDRHAEIAAGDDLVITATQTQR